MRPAPRLAPLSFPVALAAAMPAVHAWADPPAEVQVNAVVRDFSESHPDFNVVPAEGLGHCAGNIEVALAGDERPTFVGGGFKVATQWRRAAGDPIAPHLFAASMTSIPVAQPTSPPVQGELDTWDSSIGPYGGANVGPAPSFDVGAPMPRLAVPMSLRSLASLGDLALDDTTISTSFHCDELDLNGTITIDGDVSILCDEELLIATNAVIELQPGASLHLYLMAGSSSWNHTDINVNTGDPGRVKVWNLSSVGFTIHNHARVYARIFSPDASLELTNHGALFGTFAGQTVNFGNHGDLHLDTAAPLDSCSSALADVAGTAGAGSSGGIVSAATFDQWFRDVLGTNFSMILPLKLLRNGEGVYEHLSDAFHPVDGLLFGNEGRPHNDWFTLALEVEFVYGACTGQFLEFEGSDDAWIFVDGVLAIDLGGVVPATSQLVEMDRLDLTDGAVHAVHLFYAHRGPSTPVFRLRTNVVPLAPPGGDTITVSATVD